MRKDYSCPGTEFWLKNVRTIYWEKFSKLRILDAILDYFMHEYSEIGIQLNLIFTILKQSFDKMS